MTDESLFNEDDIIYAYTRADALEDGALVDVSETAREAGFRVPVALTRAAWIDAVEWDEAADKRKPSFTGQSESGRLWDVLSMAGLYSKNTKGVQFLFPVLRVPLVGRGVRPRKTHLKCHIGPGDNAEPVITIMMPDED